LISGSRHEEEEEEEEEVEEEEESCPLLGYCAVFK